MNTREVAEAFCGLLRENKHQEAAAEFNADEIVSLEAMQGPMAEVCGAQAVKAKADWWFGAHEVHSNEAFGPYVNGDQFSIRFNMDVTAKESGERMQMEEVGLYTVRDGKITEERFFY